MALCGMSVTPSGSAPGLGHDMWLAWASGSWAAALSSSAVHKKQVTRSVAAERLQAVMPLQQASLHLCKQLHSWLSRLGTLHGPGPGPDHLNRSLERTAGST